MPDYCNEIEVAGNIYDNPELIANNADEELFSVENYKEDLEERRNIEAQEEEWNKTDWGRK